EKVLALKAKLSNQDSEHLVFYEDEVDIDFNPKIGTDWQLKGEKKHIISKRRLNTVQL
ncbi:hypothetical protein ITK37_004524, partial [Salmonella enterica]|nr:hypothetical protein [Salmonella enterica]HCT4903824.1 hypothetical protein [Salmonella enterica]